MHQRRLDCTPASIIVCHLLLAVAAAAQVAVTTLRTDKTATHLNLSVISPTDANETDFAVGDVDNDGDRDVVVARKVPFTPGSPLANLLLLNDGAGTLTDFTTTLTTWTQVARMSTTREVELVDLDGNGWLDVIFYNTREEPTEIFLNLGNDALGTWQGFAPTPTTIGGGGRYHICGGATCDYDNDGLIDIFRSDYSGRLFGPGPDHYGNDIQRQSAPMTFTNVSHLLPGAIRYNDFGTEVRTTDPITGADLDVNLDGEKDIVYVGSDELSVLYGDGMGSFVNTQMIPINAVYAAAVTDFDHDGRVDFFKVTDFQDAVQRNLSTNMDGTINQSAPQTLPNTDDFGANPIAVDFNLDGHTDVFVHAVDPDEQNCAEGTPLKLFLGTGNPAQLFTLDGTMTWPNDTFDAAVADFDGDNIPDLLTSGCPSSGAGWRYYLSDRNASPTDFRSRMAPNQLGTLFEILNFPPSPNFQASYSFFDILLDGEPTAPGPFYGLREDVILQVRLPGPPFNLIVPPGMTSYALQVPALPIPNVNLVRTVTLVFDPLSFFFDVTPLTELDLL